MNREPELLLRAALGEVAAWRELRPGLDLDRLEGSSVPLLPLVYRSLERAGAADPLLPRLKGIYRSAWVKNNLLLERARTELAALSAAGIDPLLVGGIANALRFYGDLGLRPTLRLELVVDRAAEAEAVRATHAATIVRTAIGPGLPVPYDELRAAAGTLDLRGQEARVLAPADELVNAAANSRPLRVLDAALIARNGVDVDRLTALAQRYRHTIALRETLGTLARLPGAEQSASARRRLENASVSPRERLVHALRSRRGGRRLARALSRP